MLVPFRVDLRTITQQKPKFIQLVGKNVGGLFQGNSLQTLEKYFLTLSHTLWNIR
jgi:hypothetical protein